MYRCEELTIIIPNHVQQLNMKQVFIGRVKISDSGILEVLAEGSPVHKTIDSSEKDAAYKAIFKNNLKILNLCHIPEDGRLKTLSFSTADKERVKEILEFGERVDGSSLFSFIEPEKSDIYITPRTDKFFTNPFTILPTLNILCDYRDENGKPLNVAPQNVLTRAEKKLQSAHGVALKALFELEFYIIEKQRTEILFPGSPDANYHESSPFANFEEIRNEVLATLSIIGISTKYGHSEVGKIISKDGTTAEQHEIELTPQSLGDMADNAVIAKWVIRNVCARHGVFASFSPKISLNHAGSGMHIHLCALRRGRNIVSKSDGSLSKDARCMIAGILKLTPSLVAFGNPMPVSYLRFVDGIESPMHICWSERNRLALVRIPLWWRHRNKAGTNGGCRETFEFRAPDAFANTHLILAGLALAANRGLDDTAESLRESEAFHLQATNDRDSFRPLPRSCIEAAENLQKDREYYEAGDVFPSRIIEGTIQKLNSYNDRNLWNDLSINRGEIEKILGQYLHFG
jgi:glutamine synthetase